MEFRKMAFQIFLGSVALLVFVLLSAFFGLNFSDPESESDCHIPVFAAPDVPTGTQSPQVTQGKATFNSYCSACHKMSAKATGPALGKTDSVTFQKWTRSGKYEMASKSNDSTGLSFHHDLAENHISKKEFAAIYIYIKWYSEKGKVVVP